jgi:hypothetical protein
MELTVDDDVKAVLEMMVSTIPAGRLVAVANGIQKIAPLLWGQFEAEEVNPLTLKAFPIEDHGGHTRPTSTGQSLDS